MNTQIKQKKYWEIFSIEDKKEARVQLIKELQEIRKMIKEFREKEFEIQLLLENEWYKNEK